VKLAIDPGHGGTKPGASANRIVEKDLVLEVCHDLYEMVAATGHGIPVMTRTDDSHVTHDERGRLTLGSDLVLSIHANAATFRARGLMAFYWPGNALGKQVAAQIQRSSPWPLSSRSGKSPYAAGINWPRVRYVLRHHRPTTVLVEVGFLTNLANARSLRNPGVRRELAACILTGVARAATLIQTP
jgi:N-acetylmuramoyl-L-alanine amidase